MSQAGLPYLTRFVWKTIYIHHTYKLVPQSLIQKARFLLQNGFQLHHFRSGPRLLPLLLVKAFRRYILKHSTAGKIRKLWSFSSTEFFSILHWPSGLVFCTIIPWDLAERLVKTTNFDFTTQSDTTQPSQSHHNCVDTWACRTASATMPVYFSHDMHINSAPG